MNDVNRYIDETFPDTARPIASLESEVARLAAELAATQAQAAAMRAALEAVAVVDEYDCPGDAPEVCGRTCLVCAVDPDIEPHKPSCALSPDAGRGWLSPDDAERLKEILNTSNAHVKEALELLGVDVSVNGYVPDSWTLREQCHIAGKQLAAKDAEIERLRDIAEQFRDLFSRHGVRCGTWKSKPCDCGLAELTNRLAALNGKATP